MTRDMTSIPSKWYEVRHFSDDISLITETYIANWVRCNIWHIKGRDRDLLIDSGMGVRPLKQEVSSLNEKPVVCVSSHGHFDHIGGSHEFDCRLGHQSEAEIYSHPTAQNTATTGFVRAETFEALPYEGFSFDQYEVKAAPLTGYLDEGDVVDLGNRHFNVLHMPGHSPGSIALYEEATGVLFSGDILYDGELYDTVYHSDRALYRQSLQRLREWPATVIHGGHDNSFDKDRMKALIDQYLSGSTTITDPDSWVSSKVNQ